MYKEVSQLCHCPCTSLHDPRLCQGLLRPPWAQTSLKACGAHHNTGPFLLSFFHLFFTAPCCAVLWFCLFPDAPCSDLPQAWSHRGASRGVLLAREIRISFDLHHLMFVCRYWMKTKINQPVWLYAIFSCCYYWQKILLIKELQI